MGQQRLTITPNDKSIKAAYEGENFTVMVNPLSFFQDDYGLKYGLKDGQEEDDDDDDDGEDNEDE